MKKLLALVLALVMSMSLVTISNAAFSDADKIDHKEAVEVMNALGVINGMPDGSFAPAGNVTRAEMAKMITIIMLGDIDAAAFKGTTTDLTDINGHWAEGYIKYCYSQGVIAGRGDGTFAPNANVTASEAAKMLLVAIGYDADIQQYVGADWKINVARDAQTKRFYADLKGLTADKTLTRDEAAQMIYNAIQADGVEIKKGWNSEDNKITYTYQDAPSLLSSTFKAVTVEGQFVSVDKVTSGPNKGTYNVEIAVDNNPLNNITFQKVKADYSALFGQAVAVMVYDKNKTANYVYNANDDVVLGVYGQYANAATALIALSGVEKTADKKIKADGVVYSLDSIAVSSWTVAVDGTLTQGATTNAAALDNAAAGSKDAVKLIDLDGDGDYDRVVKFETTTAEVTYVDSSKVIAGAKTYKYDDAVIYTGAAKKDVIALSYNLTESKTELTKLEKVSAKLTATKATNKYQFNGEWLYNASAMSIGQTYDYYVINGVIVKFDQTTSSDMSNLVFVSAVDSGVINKTARIYYVDGTNKTVTVDETSSGAVAPTAYGLYTVSETSNGYKFKALSAYDPDGAGALTYESEDAIYTDYTYKNAAVVASSATNVETINSKAIDDNAVIFVYSGNNQKAKVITGKQLKTLPVSATPSDAIDDAAVGSFQKSVNGLTKVTVAAVAWTDSTPNTWTHFTPSASAAQYALVTSAPVTYDEYLEYTIWTGSENLTVKDKDKNSVNKFAVVGYDGIDKDGYIKLDTTNTDTYDATQAAAASELGAGAVQGFEKTSNGYDLYINGTAGTNKFTTDSKTLFLTINSTADKADEIGVATDVEIKTADKVYGVYCQNVLVLADNSKVAKVVVFDATNRLGLKAGVQKSVTALAGLTVTDEDGNAVTAGSKVKVGDILTVKNNAASTITLTTAAGVQLVKADGTTDVATITYAAGSTTILVVTGDADVNLAV